MKRIAFIDLGSNSVRFVIYEISKTGSYRLIYQEKESVRLMKRRARKTTDDYKRNRVTVGR